MSEKNLNLLLDCVSIIYDQIDDKCSVYSELEKMDSFRTRLGEMEIIKSVAKGAFGKVYVVKYNGETKALKRVEKSTVLSNRFTSFYMEEKDIMIKAYKSEWLVGATMTFQDCNALYFLMDFYRGGDLLDLLENKKNFTEDEIRFYAAEMVMALSYLHKMGYVHRDLKPDNFILDDDGHLRLADFGSCIKLNSAGLAYSSIPVGTPDYISPEILCGDEKIGYGTPADFWSLAVLITDLKFGEPIFYNDNLTETYSRIQNIDLRFPEGDISPELKDLISRLICKSEDRLKEDEIKAHPFFKGIDWENLRNSKPPVEITVDEIIREPVEIESLSSQSKPTFDFIGFSHDSKAVDSLAARLGIIGSGSSKICEECAERRTPGSVDMEEIRMSLADKEKVKNLLECVESISLKDDSTGGVTEGGENLDEARQEFEEAKEKFSAESSVLKEKILFLEEELRKREEAAMKKEESLKSSELKQREMEIELSSVISDLNRSKSGLEEKEALLKKMDEDLLRKELELKTLKENLVEMEEKEKERVEIENRENETRNAAIEEISKISNEKKDHLLKEGEEIKAKQRQMIAELECEIASLKTKNSAETNELAAMVRRVGELEAEKKRLKTEKKQMQHLTANIKNTVVDILENTRMLRSHISGLTLEIEKLNQELKVLKAERKPDESKKELRLKRLEIREMEQKLEQEVKLRKKIEDELKYVKEKNLQQAVVLDDQFEITIVQRERNEIEGNVLKIHQGRLSIGSFSEFLSNVLILEILNTELHTMRDREKALMVKMVVLSEGSFSSSKSQRTRSAGVIREEMAREENIKEGLVKMAQLLPKGSREQALKQVQGSENRLEELRAELRRSNESNIVDERPLGTGQYEYNNHIFMKTSQKSTSCFVCGVFIQSNAFRCIDCEMTTHRECYILTETSCELYAAMKTGRVLFIKMRNIEDKNRLLQIKGN